jgi:hypothetical protein
MRALKLKLVSRCKGLRYPHNLWLGVCFAQNDNRWAFGTGPDALLRETNTWRRSQNIPAVTRRRR